MSTFREIVYIVLDEIKSNTGDSSITEEHVIFLANLYRLFLLELKKQKEGDITLSSANLLTICIDLIPTLEIPGLDYCNDLYLKSELEIPTMLEEEDSHVYMNDFFNIRTALVSRERFKYVGTNKYMRNIIYCAIGPDNHLYLKSMNPQFKYMKTATITGVFEDSQKAAELSCDKDGDAKCDILDLTFPLQADLIPQMIELIVKELLGVNYRPADRINDDVDNMSDLIAFLRRNTKSNFLKLIEV